MKNLSKILMTGLIILSSAYGFAQNKTDKKAKQAMLTAERINGKDFLFNANYVTPMRGGGHTLTDTYDLTVSADSVIAYLPYFGRAYLAPNYGSTDNGIKFTWTKFTYQINPDKKNGFEVIIKPVKADLSDPNGVRSITLSVGSTGYASLQVNNLNRDPISFDGTIEARKSAKLNKSY